MIKTTVFLACIVLMGSAIRDVYNQTQGGNLRSFISMPIQIDRSGNPIFPSASFIETEVVPRDNVTVDYNGTDQYGNFSSVSFTQTADNVAAYNDTTQYGNFSGVSFIQTADNITASSNNTVNSVYGSLVEAHNNTASHVPLAFVETEAGQVTSTDISRDLYVCPSGYNYLSYNDQVKNSADLCNKIVYWGIYRLEGGGSADGPGYKCASRPSDPRSLGQAFCAKTTVQEKIKADSENCPPGYDRASVEEVSGNSRAFCDLLDTWDIARIGLRGSVSGKGYGCAVKEWHDDPLGHSACVKRSINDVKTVQQNEEICGKDKTLITAQEAFANKNDYCNLIPAWGIARLAGGASMDSSSYGCKIRHVDKRVLKQAICGPANR